MYGIENMRGTYDSRAIVGRPSFEPIASPMARRISWVSATTKQNSTKNPHDTPQSSSKRVRCGVVGLGYIAQVAVLPAFRHAQENSELVALISDDETKRAKLAKKYSV